MPKKQKGRVPVSYNESKSKGKSELEDDINNISHKELLNALTSYLL
jgi:hypothetical protein